LIKFQLRQDVRGSALLGALLFLLALLLIGAAAVNLAHLEQVIARRHSQYLQASYLAESGIEQARALIFHNPDLLNDAGASYGLELDEPGLEGQALVTVTRPASNGLLTIKSSATMTGEARRIWQATMTAPPDYEIYCRGVQLNPILDIGGTLEAFGVQDPGPVPIMQGELSVDPACRGAYQTFDHDSIHFTESNHTHRYQPPGVDISFWRQVAGTGTIDWRPYEYQFYENSILLPLSLENRIIAVNGDVLIYGQAVPIAVNNCIVVASGDIWVIDMSGVQGSAVSGVFLAGRDVSLCQSSGDMQVRANLVAGRNVNFCCGGTGDRIRLQPVAGQEFVRGCPPVLRGKLGFLSIKFYVELAN